MGEWFPFLDRAAEDLGLKAKSGRKDGSLIRPGNIVSDVLRARGAAEAARGNWQGALGSKAAADMWEEDGD